MPFHTVKQGEHLSGIAAKRGLSDIDAIWGHPENAQLRQQRENPNVLLPGDKVFVPDRIPGSETAATEQRHRFRLHGPRLELRLRLLDFDNQPLADTECRLVVGDHAEELTTDGDGRIACRIPRSAEQASLLFKDPLVQFDLSTVIKIGHLDPIDEASGQQARLANLGYFCRRDDGRDDERFDHAVQEFQCDHGLTVTGECGPKTQAKLEEVYGC